MSRLAISSRSKWKGTYSKIKLDLYQKILKLRQMNNNAMQKGKQDKKKKETPQKKSIFSYTSWMLINSFLRNNNSRASVILSKHVGKQQNVDNGRICTPLRVTTDFIGHRFGEFHRTTRQGAIIHKNNAKSKKIKSKK